MWSGMQNRLEPSSKKIRTVQVAGGARSDP